MSFPLEETKKKRKKKPSCCRSRKDLKKQTINITTPPKTPQEDLLRSYDEEVLKVTQKSFEEKAVVILKQSPAAWTLRTSGDFWFFSMLFLRL